MAVKPGISPKLLTTRHRLLSIALSGDRVRND